ncbi:MAG TPA: hypothetical protein VK571_05385 [Gemmatimonadaceae bacterium]|nr:hypothetical protein [Gemmatimonadaceae bacterium]
MIERLSFCLNCGDRFGAPERDCQNPSPGKPYVDCGRGGHMFTKGNIHTDPPGAVRKHIGFTGTRFGMTDNQHSEVAFLLAMLGGFDILITSHHGDCIGSDAEFHELARRCGALVEVHPGPANDVARQAGCFDYTPTIRRLNASKAMLQRWLDADDRKRAARGRAR